MQSTVSVIEQHAANATCSARCVLCKLQETRRASERPLQRPDLEELWGLWLQEVGRDIRRQDDAGEFLHMLLRESPELRACFAQETGHHDTYAAQCGASGCHATANDTSEEEVLVDVHIPEEEPREADLSVVLGQDMTVAEFDSIYVCACAEPYVAVDCLGLAQFWHCV